MNAVVKIDHLPAASAESTIDRIISATLNQDFDVDKIKDLYDLKLKYDANEARKAYVAAMAAFKSEPLRITKDKHVKFATQKGITEYDHATIGNVVEVVTSALGAHQLAHRWDTHQENGKITVICIITHAHGHSESTMMTASPDDSGGKNGIQAIASTVTYLQRYTLLAATGLATRDQDDDDGAGSDQQDTAKVDPHAEWFNAISACVDATGLQAVKKELSLAFGAKTPPHLIGAYNAKLRSFDGDRQ